MSAEHRQKATVTSYLACLQMQACLAWQAGLQEDASIVYLCSSAAGHTRVGARPTDGLQPDLYIVWLIRRPTNAKSHTLLYARMLWHGRDAEAAGVADLIDLSHGPCAVWRPPAKPRLVICNPPWGNRLAGGRPAGHLPWGAAPQADPRRGDRGAGRGGAPHAGPRTPGNGRWEVRGGRGGSMRLRDGERGVDRAADGAEPMDGSDTAGGPEAELAAAWRDLGVFLKVRSMT